ncbi:FAD/NAD(P)-binding domain-containing protein [Podospora aff. communis PSN243]|uniref:FAD/NAD(P)-binding domain-containing protein n=1 Tax=Podospora aff. communis PSN243 TaxID=3040156 RepID=A0AAV9G473_9PEZI|nr:FAD/NAD(P)-binding domain-containing protein [Podospora aff. communis PSN243]
MAFNNDPRFGPGKSVAVIGAGIGGVSAAAYLLKEGLSVTVFERSGVGGGIWHFDERIPKDPPYPNEKPSHGDYEVSQRGEFANPTPPPEPADNVKQDNSNVNVDIEVSFAPPGPCYAGLTNNIPTSVLVNSLGPWPAGTEETISQELAEKYINGLASDHGVTAVTQFNTRVDEIKPTPDNSAWEIRTVSLEKRPTGSIRLKERLHFFNLVVVATGHYSTPRIPSFPGLPELKAAFPNRILHSKQYRRPEPFRGQNVLVIGAGVSSSDICKELAPTADKVYQSVRGGAYDTPPHLLPASTIRVGPISSFQPPQTPSDETFTINLHSRDTPLTNIHTIILATGYITSYPFLSHLHSDTTPSTSATPTTLVAQGGDMVHNLHQDIFYIPNPTLAFIGVPYHAAAFTLFGFQAQVLAKVFAGKATLPTEEGMREVYKKKVQEKGLGRAFHSLAGKGVEVGYVRGLVEWVNRDGEELGLGEKVEGVSEDWVIGYEAFKGRVEEEWFRGRERG